MSDVIFSTLDRWLLKAERTLRSARLALAARQASHDAELLAWAEGARQRSGGATSHDITEHINRELARHQSGER